MALPGNKGDKDESVQMNRGADDPQINYDPALHKGHHHVSGRLHDLTSLHHRNPIIHWAAFAFALISLIPPLFWVISPTQNLSAYWMWIDVGLGVFFGAEFLTRSGLRWNPASYMGSRFFDFVAVVPALVLVHFQVPHLQVWVWIILVARFGRVIDRVLGDGFWTRNLFALLEGFEEEITDRVMLRIITRVRIDLERGSFAKGLSDSLAHNKENLLKEVRQKHPQEGISGSLAKITGFNNALERAEERAFDAVIEIIKSPEVDRAIREAVDSAFVTVQKEIEVKSWRGRLGIKPEAENEAKKKPTAPKK
jgi:voltage-gated potassium channel